MYRKPNESALDYKNRINDSISKTYCGAKWYGATIWLGSGHTASCHHPPPHKISLAEIKNNPSALHNTMHKKLMRAQMLKGERPKECEYCWKIEDSGTTAVSDRVHKTEMFSDSDHQVVQNLNWKKDSVLRHLEIAFDRACQFACSYCNAGYSTKWGQDIKQNGPYQNLVSDGAGAFWHHGAWAEPYPINETNPYVEAFWSWWPELSETLEEFRITGGEPTMSIHFWKLLEILKTKPPRDEMIFSVNTNLGLSPEKLDDFLLKTAGIKKLGIYTSCDSVGAQAEYIRDGLNYKNYCSNIERILQMAKPFRLQMMVTVNSLSLYGLTDWMDQMIEWKKSFGSAYPAFGLTILRFPSFMSPSTLPLELRLERANHFSDWYQAKKDLNILLPHEKDTIERLIIYLKEVEDPHFKTSDLQKRQHDFKTFYSEYDKRRNKSFERTFPKILVDWYKSIPATKVSEVQDFIYGDATDGYHNPEELNELKTRMETTL